MTTAPPIDMIGLRLMRASYNLDIQRAYHVVVASQLCVKLHAALSSQDNLTENAALTTAIVIQSDSNYFHFTGQFSGDSVPDNWTYLVRDDRWSPVVNAGVTSDGVVTFTEPDDNMFLRFFDQARVITGETQYAAVISFHAVHEPIAQDRFADELSVAWNSPMREMPHLFTAAYPEKWLQSLPVDP